MHKIALVVLAIMMGSACFATAALAQTPPATSAPDSTQPGQYPSVANLRPFSAEADYMSLAGYLRYLVFQQTAQWLTRPEAERIVGQQHGM
jgi:hypothetical protein